MKFRWRWPFSVSPVDWWLYLLPILLAAIGVAVIASLTYGTARIALAMNQSIYAGIGIIVMVLLTRFDYRHLKGLAPVIYLLVLVLLGGVALFGTTVFGAQRWLDLGFFQLQPSELEKLALILVLARFFSDREQFGLKDYLYLLGLIGLPLVFILAQPDLGTTAILLLVSAGLMLASSMPRRFLIGAAGVGLLTTPIVWQFLKPYQQERVLTFLNPSADPYGAGYNVLQALIAVGSGGKFGQGLGQGSQSQLQFLPVAHTDFIFAGLAEATGLVGSLAFLGLLTFFIFRVIRVAQLARDSFGRSVAIGLAILVISQSAIHIAMNLGLAPVTGIPLPFVSHGGTSLIVNFMAIGILQSILLRHKKITF